MTTPAIEVRDLVKRYRKGTGNAVDGVSFDVEPGKFFALLGPNGDGKGKASVPHLEYPHTGRQAAARDAASPLSDRLTLLPDQAGKTSEIEAGQVLRSVRTSV